jgi:peptidoglycan hydrolase-like protein with peptidoglycan-binding domain
MYTFFYYVQKSLQCTAVVVGTGIILLVTPATTNACGTATPGTSGENVSCIQQYLTITNDFDYPAITGYYGPATVAAVKQFQTRTHIATVTPGIYDTETANQVSLAVIAALKRDVTNLLAQSSQNSALLAASVTSTPTPSPANNATGISALTNATLSWPSTGSGITYKIYVSTTTSFTSTNLATSTTKTTATIPPLQPNTKYYWRVDSIKGSTTTKGTTWQFTTSDKLGLFVMDEGSSHDYATSTKVLNDFKTRANNILGLSYVDGFELVYTWQSFAPTSSADTSNFSKYHFDAIDYAIQKAVAMGKKIALRFEVASYAPQYVKDECGSFTYTHTEANVGIKTAAIPWNDCYYTYLNRMTKALASKYDGNPNIRTIQINGPSTLFGVETNWPMKAGSISTADLAKLNFSMDHYIGGWNNSINIFTNNFPKTQLALALNDEILFDGVTEDQAVKAVQKIRDYGISTYAQKTKRANKKLVVELLGLDTDNPKYFPGMYDGTTKNLNNYVSLAWDKKDVATLLYEWGTVSTNAGDASSTFQYIFDKGVSWLAKDIDVKYPDVWDTMTNQPKTMYQQTLITGAPKVRP